MISDFFIMLFAGMVEGLTRCDPTVSQNCGNWSVPPWFTDLSGYAGTVFGVASSMGVWFPWTVVVTVVGAVLFSILAGFGIRILRIIISTFTGGGGAA